MRSNHSASGKARVTGSRRALVTGAMRFGPGAAGGRVNVLVSAFGALLVAVVVAALVMPAGTAGATGDVRTTGAVRTVAATQATPASASASGAGAAFCNTNGGGGLSTSGASLDDVYPCANPNISDEFGYQCTEFSYRFEATVYGKAPLGGYGYQVVGLLHSHYGIPVGSPGPGVLPVPGDILSMGGAYYTGHTGVIDSVVPTGGTGNYRVTYLDENGSLSGGGSSIGEDSITVRDWVWQPAFTNSPYRYDVYSWTEQGGTPPPTTFVTSFEASSNDLNLYSSSDTDRALSLGIAPGTSPSIARLSNGTYEVAFEGAGNDDLWLYSTSTGAATHLGLGMMAGTSPSIAALTDGSYQVAFQANTGDLYLYTPGKNSPLGLGMMKGTSPSITGLPDGSYEVAFQANTGDLYLYTPGKNSPLGLGMMKGTSPSITGLPDGSYEVAFQANTSDLYLYTPGKNSPLGLGMMKGTSPSIAVQPSGGIVVAFEANTDDLWLYSSTGGAKDQDQGMMKGTCPSITAVGSGDETAFEANTGALIVWGTPQTRNTGLAMNTTSSPSIA